MTVWTFHEWGGGRWRRGVYRLVVVLALTWAGALGWAFYEDRPTEALVAKFVLGYIDAGHSVSPLCGDASDLGDGSKLDPGCDVRPFLAAASGDAGRAFDAWADALSARTNKLIEKRKQELQEEQIRVEARRQGATPGEYRRQPAQGVSQEVFDQLKLTMAKDEIKNLEQTRDRLPESRAAFVRDIAELRREQFAHWVRPTRIWLLSVLGAVVGIEALAWVVRGFLPRR